MHIVIVGGYHGLDQDESRGSSRRDASTQVPSAAVHRRGTRTHTRCQCTSIVPRADLTLLAVSPNDLLDASGSSLEVVFNGSNTLV